MELRSDLKNSSSIEDRVVVVEQRSRLVNLQGNPMIGEKDGCGLVVVMDRKPQGVVVKLVRTRKSNHSTTALPGLMPLRKGSYHKLALDNSYEFGVWTD